MSLAQKAYEQLETLLITLELAPGSFLTEGELIQRLNLGRTPVREAVQRLATQCMLTIQPRRGILVTPISLSEHLALIETKRELERLIAGLAARKSSPEQRAQLEDLAGSMRRAARRQELAAYLEADKATDYILATAAQNSYATLAVGPLRTQCRRFWYAYRSEINLFEFAELHAELLHAVASGDPERSALASDALSHALEGLSRKALELAPAV